MRVITRRSDPVDDPLPEVFFRSPRRRLDGWGVAARIELPAPWPDHVDRVTDALQSATVDDEIGAPGCGPVALGALPFDRDAPATLVVPARIVGTTTEGARWTTTIQGARGDAPTPSDPAPLEPERVTIESDQSTEAWCESVDAATKRIAAGDLTKVVLARRLIATGDVPWHAPTVARRLAEAHPHALAFLVDGFCGASPELLVSRIDDVVRAQPMAGTTPRTGDPDVDAKLAAELLASAKNREEHQITIDEVLEALLPWCSYVDAEPEPSVAAAGSVQHLASFVDGRLSHPTPSVLELVAALHPTPAVGGWPRAAALDLIAELEPEPRGRYAGPVGWVDASGNGAWAVGIRSVTLNDTTAELWAGVGVVADSDPQAELDETGAKFAATLDQLARG
jgi:menaquinone-specific isochorismate synthase